MKSAWKRSPKLLETCKDISCILQVRELRAEIDRLLLLKIQDTNFDLSTSKAVDALHSLLATDGF